MIKINKNFKNPPLKLISESCEEIIERSLIEKSSHDFSKYHYRDSCIEELKILYNNKCAFCETNPDSGGSYHRVDHYRPKKGIKNESHVGYYWLAYKWSNLILICETCNSKKSNHFPLSTSGVRVKAPKKVFSKKYFDLNSKIYKDEQALILNPEVDEVEKHFLFHPNGEMEGLTERGKKTIEICDLNRVPLIIARKKIVDDYSADFKACIDNYIKTNSKTFIKYTLNDLFIKLSKLGTSHSIYSRFGWFMFMKFKFFFSDQFENKSRQILHNSFEKFIKGELV